MKTRTHFAWPFRLPFLFDHLRAVKGRRSPIVASILLMLPLMQGRLSAQQYPQIGPSYESPSAPSQDYGAPPPIDQQPDSYGAQPQPYAYPQQNTGPVQGLNADQLEQLVAPIALYPDNLIAMVLAASTYPTQVIEADHWRQAQGNAPADQIATEAEAQQWDASVKALTAFPQVLEQMDQNLQWTTALGNAYFNQPQDVMEAVQVMRQRAQAAGNLQSTPQETVGYYQGNIALYPASPQVVYVPTYNPWTVYGQPVSPYPGFSLFAALGSFFGSSPIQWGLGIAMSAFSHTPWGWLTWGLNWLTQSVLFHQSNYYSNSHTVADWHLPRNGGRAFYGMNGSYRPTSGYNRGGYNMARPQTGYRSGYGFAPQQPQRPTFGYGETRPTSTPYNRPYSSPAFNYSRPTQEAYNRSPGMISRPQQYNRPAYSNYGSSYTSGSGFYNRPMQSQSYASRPAPAFTNPAQSFRAPSTTIARNDFAPRSTSGFPGYSAHPEPSGGFHLFGSGHSSENFYGGGHASKGFSAPKSFSSHSSGGGFHFGGHSGGGGHSSSHGGGGHHH